MFEKYQKTLVRLLLSFINSFIHLF